VIFSILVGILGDFGHFGAKMGDSWRFWWLGWGVGAALFFRFRQDLQAADPSRCSMVQNASIVIKGFAVSWSALSWFAFVSGFVRGGILRVAQNDKGARGGFPASFLFV
jgi:hypothetical protein